MVRSNLGGRMGLSHAPVMPLLQNPRGLLSLTAMSAEEREAETTAQKREAEEGEEEPESKKQKKLYESEPADKSDELDKKQQQHEEKGDSEHEDEGSESGDVHMWKGEVPKVLDERAPVPEKDEDGCLAFQDHPEFRPNLTPKEVIQRGSFGGTYFRPIYSAVIDAQVEGDWKELPSDWFEGLDPEKDCCKAWGEYDKTLNTHKVKCGRELEFWEQKGWISPIDPRGWFQWSEDDERQIGRGNRLMGPKGRFRLQLINRCVKAGKSFDDESVSPVMRQVLQHWGYVLTEKDFKAYAKEKGYDV